MTAMLDQYLADLQHRPNHRGRQVSPATIRAARADLQGFIAWWKQTHRLSFDVALVLDHELRQWQRHRQREDGAKPSTINRANASMRAFFSWAQREGLTSHNPTTDLHDLPLQEIAPRSMLPAALDWLLRAIAAQDATTRLRDLTLLALLSDCGLRAQEAADLQLRDLDLAGAMLTVRSGKGGTARRVPLTAGVVRTFRDYLLVRCSAGMPPIGSDVTYRAILPKHRHQYEADIVGNRAQSDAGAADCRPIVLNTQPLSAIVPTFPGPDPSRPLSLRSITYSCGRGYGGQEFGSDGPSGLGAPPAHDH